MSLATRCPFCGTIFRVVQDQLRVSQGWVRCGRCSEAFNALESMVDLPPPRVPMPTSPTNVENPPTPTEAPPDPGVAATTPPAAVAEQVLGAPSIDLPPGMSFIASDGAIGQTADVPRTEPAATAASEPAATSGLAPAAAPQPDEAAPIGEPHGIGAAPAAPGSEATAGAAPAVVPPGSDETAAVAEGTQPAPSFIVQAERAARWRRPGVRLALGTGVLVAALTLAAQATYTFRDRVAAAVPSARPLLVQACSLLDCRVGDVRQIDALSVETSALVRVEGTSVYRLAVTLRNRASIDIAAPALDLALTDPQGRPIARRVLQMSDLDLPLRVLKAGTELPIQVPLGIGDRQVSGYTVEIFYP